MACYISPTGTLSWDALLPYVLPKARGVPPDLALQYIRESAIEFCRRSGILHDIQQYYLQAYVEDYQLVTDPNYEIVQVFRVTVDKRWNYSPVNQKLTAGIGAFVYHMSSPTIINLRRPPAIDDPKGLEVETIVAPKQDSCVLDNYLYQQWATGIAAGALDSILSLGQTNWYDPKAAQRYADIFTKNLTRARAMIDRAFSPRSMMKTEQWIGPGNRGWGGGYNPSGWGCG